VELATFQVCEGDLDAASRDRYQAAAALAVDTEAMGLIPQRDRLCLVQLCDPSGFTTAIRIERGQAAAPQLQAVLESPEVVKVFHFARFDLAQLQYALGIRVQPIFCTKIASKLARTYTSSHGLKALVQELAGVELDKSQQSSDWGNAASLSAEQLSYAANDVRYLLELRAKLVAMLEREQRWELAQRCFACLPTLVELDLLQYGDVFAH